MYRFLVLCGIFISSCASLTDIATPWIPGFDNTTHKPYNPSLVEYNGKYYSALRFSKTTKARQKIWYMDRVFQCRSEYLNLLKLRCKPFYPFVGPYNECEFPKDIREGKVDNSGLGDLKFFTWPGRGVFAIFGRKPPRKSGEVYCSDKVVYNPYLAAVDVAPEAAAEWYLPYPLRLQVTSGYQYPELPLHLYEKNWMPWIYKANNTELLYITHMVNPHRILEVSPNGDCKVIHEVSSPNLFSHFINNDLHGGPPIIYVDAKFTTKGKSYYAGIMHYFDVVNATRNGIVVSGVKVYRHFAFKFHPYPPFMISAISDEIPFASFGTPLPTVMRTIAFVAGFSIGSDGTLYISYGAGDLEARVLSMSVREFESLFTGNMARLERKIGDDSEIVANETMTI